MPESTTTEPKHHGNQMGASKRVRLCGGPHVDKDTTKTQLDKWVKTTGSYGILLDQLVTFARAYSFKPTK